MTKLLKLIAIAFIVPSVIHGAVSVTGYSVVGGGNVEHGASIIITGSGFGTKTTAAPTLWDDCSGTNILAKWTSYFSGTTGYGGISGGDSSKDLAYRTPVQAGRSVALPHSHITKYMCGSQYYLLTDDGNDLMPWLVHSLPSYTAPVYTYVSWYRRIDPLWVWGGGDHNFKDLAYTDDDGIGDGHTPWTGNSSYMSHWNLAESCGTYPVSSPHYLGCWLSTQFGNCESSVYGAHEILEDGWVKTEWITKWSTGSDGWMQVWENGTKKYQIDGVTWFGDGPQCISIEGFFRTPNDNNWRYMADIYIDYSAQRVMIGNANTLAGCTTIRAVQIPSAWSNASITATVNQDAIADSATAYLYVFDATGASNANGYPITFGEGAETPSASTIGGAATKSGVSAK